MTRTLILGSNGMLASRMIRSFQLSNLDFDVASRNPKPIAGKQTYSVDLTRPGELTKLEPWSYDYIINCVGLIKHRIEESNPADVELAWRLNAELPHELADLLGGTKSRVIQIATDCVFSGREGGYTEDAPHDPVDLYGKTKSEGEVNSHNFLHLRSSIIGNEPFGGKGLFAWYRDNHASQVFGYRNHHWNGVTTDIFSLVTSGLVASESKLNGLHHLVPADSLSKFEILTLFRETHVPTGPEIADSGSADVLDRTLRTVDADINDYLWMIGTGSGPQTISQMIETMDVA